MNPTPSRTVFVCAHGAGGHKDDRGMLALAKALEAHGVEVVRFNFPYRDKSSGHPDPMPVLKATIADITASVREERKPAKLLIGGRSMGGRAASMLAADGFECDGLLLLAYPLHPAGRPEKLRDAHLAKIRVPVLCLNGTRDPLCRRDLMEKAIAGLPAWEMHWLDAADHSFHVLKSSGRTDPEVLEETAGVSARWLRDVVNAR
jgi:predicted alpha/beta-hydrolase family hydrolase